MSKNRNRTRRIYGIILTSFIIIWIGSVSLQMLSNRHNAWIASEMILQQLEDVIEERKLSDASGNPEGRIYAAGRDGGKSP